MKTKLTAKQKRLELESFRAALAEAEQNGDMEEYVKIIWSKSTYYYLTNFSKDELMANNEILERMSEGIVGAYQTFVMSRNDETAMNYIKEKGYTIADKPREVYVNGCWDCESEDDYITLIQIPIK